MEMQAKVQYSGRVWTADTVRHAIDVKGIDTMLDPSVSYPTQPARLHVNLPSTPEVC